MTDTNPIDSSGDAPQNSGQKTLSRFKVTLRALRHRNYRLFFGGQLISLIGTWMQMVALSWLVYRLTGSSFLMGATGLGALAGAISLAARSNTRGLWKLVAFASAGFGNSLILFSVSRSFWLSALFLIPVGFSFMLQMASTNTLIQIMVPDELRGRVMAVHVTMFMGMAPFGSFLAGIIAEKLGAPLAVTIGGICCLAGSALFAARLSATRLLADRPIQTRAD